MVSELVFRIIFTVLWLVFIVNLTWVRYSTRQPKQQTQTVQTTQEHTEKRWHTVALALFAPFWFGGIILYMFIPSWIAFLSIPLTEWFRLIMVGVAILSIPFTLWSYRTIGKNWVHALDPSEFTQKKDNKLVTVGPYRIVRNPLYLGSFTFILSLALLASNWLILLPAIMIVVLIYTRISGEEKMLLDRFGNEYQEYMKKTPRIIPRIKSR
jgi:protein-S-isoprenylcysteine O-methyltransferase Ste14